MANNGSSSSLGRQCASYGCFEYLYMFKNGVRVVTGNKFFSFPKEQNEINAWCNLIKRQNGKDGFKVTSATRICSKHFPSSEIYRPPGGTKCRLLANAMPTLHVWNDFQGGKTRKAPTVRGSPRKKCRTQELVEHNNNTGISLTSDVDFDIKATDITPIPSGNSTLSELRKSNEDLLAQIKKLEMEQKNKITNFTEHVLSSDKNCNHYTAFPKVDVLNAVLEFLDPGSHGENIVLYNSKSANKEQETRGRKRHFTPLESFILTMVRLRRNFDVKHLSYLCNASERTISNTINTWINFMYLKLGSINIWPNRAQVQKHMPASMKIKYPNVKCIIDCVEFKVSVPTSLYLRIFMSRDQSEYTNNPAFSRRQAENRQHKVL